MDKSVPSSPRASSLGNSGAAGSSSRNEGVDIGTDATDETGVGEARPSVSISLVSGFGSCFAQDFGSGFISMKRVAIISMPSIPNLLPPISQNRTPPLVTAERNSPRISVDMAQLFIFNSSTFRRWGGGFCCPSLVSKGGSTTTIDELSVDGIAVTNVADSGECGVMSGSSGPASSSFSVFSSTIAVSSLAGRCRLELGLVVLVRSAPTLMAIGFRNENFRCRCLGAIGCSRNSGGISRRKGLGSAIARARMVAASTDNGIFEIFRETRSAF